MRWHNRSNLIKKTTREQKYPAIYYNSIHREERSLFRKAWYVGAGIITLYAATYPYRLISHRLIKLTTSQCPNDQ